MELFPGNPFPQHLQKNDDFKGLFVANKEELAEAIADGYSQTHVPHEYPKFVRHPQGKIDKDTGRVIKQRCQDKAEEEAYLASFKPKKEEKAA